MESENLKLKNLVKVLRKRNRYLEKQTRYFRTLWKSKLKKPKRNRNTIVRYIYRKPVKSLKKPKDLSRIKIRLNGQEIYAKSIIDRHLTIPLKRIKAPLNRSVKIKPDPDPYYEDDIIEVDPFVTDKIKSEFDVDFKDYEANDEEYNEDLDYYQDHQDVSEYNEYEDPLVVHPKQSKKVTKTPLSELPAILQKATGTSKSTLKNKSRYSDRLKEFLCQTYGITRDGIEDFFHTNDEETVQDAIIAFIKQYRVGAEGNTLPKVASYRVLKSTIITYIMDLVGLNLKTLPRLTKFFQGYDAKLRKVRDRKKERTQLDSDEEYTPRESGLDLTKKSQKMNATYSRSEFTNFLKNNYADEDFALICKNPDNVKKVEAIVIHFFDSYRTKNGYPKINTFQLLRSHFKYYVLELSDNTLDLSDVQVFVDLNVFYINYKEKLKNLGLGAVKKFVRMPVDIANQIHKFLHHLAMLMYLPDDDEDYKHHLEQVPDFYRANYHCLVLYGAIFLVLSQFKTAPNRNSFDEMLQEDLELVEDPEDANLKYYTLSDPNFRGRSGRILFQVDEHGFNPGQFMQLYLSKQDPVSEYLFNRPQRKCKSFVLESNPKTWFELDKVGQGEFSRAVPSLCESCSLPRYTNVNARELFKFAKTSNSVNSHKDKTPLRYRKNKVMDFSKSNTDECETTNYMPTEQDFTPVEAKINPEVFEEYSKTYSTDSPMPQGNYREKTVCKPSTINAKARAIRHYQDFIQSIHGPIDDWKHFFMDKNKLQDVTIKYLKSIRVANGGLPTLSSFNVAKSHIKMYVKSLIATEITSRGLYPDLGYFFDKYTHKLTRIHKKDGGKEDIVEDPAEYKTQFENIPKYQVEAPPDKIDGLAKSTSKQKQLMVLDFENFLDKKYPEESGLINLICDVKKLEVVLIDFFQSMRTSGDSLPKINSFETKRSHLKMKIKSMTNNMVDISDANVFPALNAFIVQYKQTLKLLGYAQIDHHAPMPTDAVAVIEKLLRNLTFLMSLPASHANYKRHVEALPEDWRNAYHYLALYGAIFVFLSRMQDKKQENTPFVKKSEMILLQDPLTGIHYYTRFLTSEQLGQAPGQVQQGRIPFEENVNGFNPGLYLQHFMTKLDPMSPLVFNRPQRPKKAFVLQANPDCWFEDAKLGINEVRKAVAVLCQATGLPKYTNVNIKDLRHQHIKKRSRDYAFENM